MLHTWNARERETSLSAETGWDVDPSHPSGDPILFIYILLYCSYLRYRIRERVWKIIPSYLFVWSRVWGDMPEVTWWCGSRARMRDQGFWVVFFPHYIIPSSKKKKISLRKVSCIAEPALTQALLSYMQWLAAQVLKCQTFQALPLLFGPQIPERFGNRSINLIKFRPYENPISDYCLFGPW